MKSVPVTYLRALSVIFSVLYLCQSMALHADEDWSFSYIEGSPEGPERWGDLHKEWATCKTGTMQSPIYLSSGGARPQPSLGPLLTRNRPSIANIINTGHSIMLKWEENAGSITIGGTEYMLKQCHWHSPTEHSIDGIRFDLEVHLVHESADERIAVVAVLYQIGQPDMLLSQLTDAIRSVSNSEQREAAAGVVDPSIVEIGGGKQYFRYMGSLTTPPCTEWVTWTVMNEVSTVSSEQVSLLRRAVDKDAERNARPIQPTNGRDVFLFKQRSRFT